MLRRNDSGTVSTVSFCSIWHDSVFKEEKDLLWKGFAVKAAFKLGVNDYYYYTRLTASFPGLSWIRRYQKGKFSLDSRAAFDLRRRRFI